MLLSLIVSVVLFNDRGVNVFVLFVLIIITLIHSGVVAAFIKGGAVYFHPHCYGALLLLFLLVLVLLRASRRTVTQLKGFPASPSLS